MKNKRSKQYTIMLISFAAFIVFSLVYRDARYKWNDILYMVLSDIALSASSAAAAVCIATNRKLLCKILTGVAGFLLPNAFIWGLALPLGEIISNGGKATAISFIAMFATYAIISLCAFLFGSSGKNLTSRITAFVVAAVMLVCSAISSEPLKIKDTEEKYNESVKSVNIYENDFESALPQTEIYNIVRKHFKSPLADGKTEKKCIVIGFDGTRADMLTQYKEHEKSAIKEIMSSNGHAKLMYCGGVQWPAENTQKTSTAPGWCSILTGCWADSHGIYTNYVPKTLDKKSLFLTLLEDNTVDSTKFCVSWNGHFNDETCTYYPEKQYAEANGLNASYVDASDDDGTYKNVASDISSADCSDFLFCIFEECDHVGHQTNFTPENFGYIDAFRNNDEYAYDILEKIKGRETYEAEDWLILITTDHGGYLDEHGGATKQERYTFVISNKEI